MKSEFNQTTTSQSIKIFFFFSDSTPLNGIRTLADFFADFFADYFWIFLPTFLPILSITTSTSQFKANANAKYQLQFPNKSLKVIIFFFKSSSN